MNSEDEYKVAADKLCILQALLPTTETKVAF